jgi:hypothetical protein
LIPQHFHEKRQDLATDPEMEEKGQREEMEVKEKKGQKGEKGEKGEMEMTQNLVQV